MRKKIFATLMSVAMIASFMPSMAFAAHVHTYPMDYKSGTVTWDAVQKALKTDDAKYITIVKEPTHTENGIVKLTCKDDYCNEVTDEISVTDAANHVAVQKDLSLEEYANAMVEQKTDDTHHHFANKTAAAKWVKDQAETVCYKKNVNVCKACGYVEPNSGTDEAHSTVNHKYDCVDYTCANANCGKTIKATTEHTFVKIAGAKKVSEPTCGHGTGYEGKCACGATGVAYDSDVNGLAHDYGESVKAVDATLKTADGAGFVVKSGYVGVKGKTVITFNNHGTVATAIKEDPADYTFYKLNHVKTEAKSCGDTKVMDLVCKTCGKALDDAEETSTAVAHDYETTTVPATCDGRSQIKKVCKACGHEDVTNATTTDDTKAHSYKATKVAATCNEPEHYVIECTTCKKDCAHAGGVKIANDGTVTLVKSASTGITNTATTSKSTDEKAKTATYIYTGFNNELKGTDVIEVTISTVAAATHKYGPETLLKAATCETDAVYGKKCINCGKLDVDSVYTKSNTALGHTVVKNEVAATCGTHGYYTEECSTCGKVKNNADNWVKRAADTVLKETETAKPVVKTGAACKFDKWVVTKEATVFEEGVKQLECSVCGAKDATKTVVAKKTVAKPVVTLKAGKKAFTVKASADNATGYKVVYKRAGKKAITKVVDAEKLSKTYKKLAKGKKYTVKVTAFASNGTDTVYGATTTKTVKTK